jgi:ABC-2 type transport system permease protein
LVANLMFPNLNWKNEVAVVKRSASMFFTWIAIAIYLGVFFIVGTLTNFNNVDLFILLAVLITVFIDLVIWKWLEVKGSEIFRSL